MSSLLNRATVAALFGINRKSCYDSDQSARDDAARAQAAGPAQPSAALQDECTLVAREQAGLQVWTMAPKGGPATSPRILYIHGSGYIHPITSHHWDLLRELERRTRSVITVPIYEMAPKHTWKDAFTSITSIYDAMLAEDDDPVILMGDSAGATIALGVAMVWAKDAKPMPRHIVVFSPWLDATLKNADIDAIAPRDPVLGKPGLQATATWWAGGEDLEQFQQSPLNGDWSALPPVDAFIGTREIFLPDCELLATKAAKEKLPITVHKFDDTFHVWPSVTVLPEAHDALAIVERVLATSEGSTDSTI